jgi:VIT1/CCC1 family predicted Fe2+/Mn2+ transporter
MALAVLGARLSLPDGNDPATMALRLVVMVTVGALTYLGVMYLAHRERLRTFRTFLRTVRK